MNQKLQLYPNLAGVQKNPQYFFKPYHLYLCCTQFVINLVNRETELKFSGKQFPQVLDW